METKQYATKQPMNYWKNQRECKKIPTESYYKYQSRSKWDRDEENNRKDEWNWRLVLWKDNKTDKTLAILINQKGRGLKAIKLEMKKRSYNRQHKNKKDHRD